MNTDQINLIQKLTEANLTTKRFLKVDANKAAFEKEWQLNLYTPEELQDYPRWGICGGEGLVPLEADKPEMVTHLRNALPQTLEILTPRRQLPHFFYKVTDGEIPNLVLHVPNDEEGAGEIRAKNQYFVAAGTTIEFNDLKTGEPKTGTYKILHNRPIAELSYQKFMDTIKPFLGKNSEQPITKDIMQSGAEKGTRHFYGIKYACRLIGFEQLDDVAALESLKRWNTKCKPPMDEKDLMRMIQNAKQYANKYEKKFEKQNGKFIEKTLKSEPDMEYALEILNNHIYKCPTDTIEILYFDEGIYNPAKCKIHEILETEYGKDLKKHFIDEAIGHLERSNYIEREEINKFTNKIPIQNGLFNIMTREIVPFDSEQIFTYKLNVTYDPEATCPNWTKFVNQVLPSKEDQLLLQEMMGYCLFPAMPFHKMFWFYGIGRNGKGRIIITLNHILGKNNCVELNLSEFSESRRFSLSRLYGRLLNTSSEPKVSKYGLQTTVLKMVTGEDQISAELKGKNERLQFTNFAKMVVLGNHFPKVEDNSLGWWDRVETLNFPNSYEGDNKIVAIENQWIPHEINGIFNWMLEGLYRLQEQNDFTKSKSAEETKLGFMKVSDPFTAWIMENCEKIPTAYLINNEALMACDIYCDEIGADRIPKRSFYERMRKESRVKEIQKIIREKNERVFLGITLKSDNKKQLTLAELAELAVPHTQEIIEENTVQDKKTAKTAKTAKSLDSNLGKLEKLKNWIRSEQIRGGVSFSAIRVKIADLCFDIPEKEITVKLLNDGDLVGVDFGGKD